MRKYSYSEADLRDRYIDFLKTESDIQSFSEVPVFCRSVDLVLQDNREESLTAIEFKLHDWKRAIAQVQGVGLCFDFLCICLPKPKTVIGEQNIINACKSSGIGLIFYNDHSNEFETMLCGVRGASVWKAQRDLIIESLEAKSYEQSLENAQI